MAADRTLRDELRKLLNYGPLSFRDFMELALYHPEFGYYSRRENPVGKGGDYVTAPSLSPVFSFGIARLFREFMGRCEGEVCSFVDIGCGDGGLVRAVAAQIEDERARVFGVDRSLERNAGVSPAEQAASRRGLGLSRAGDGSETLPAQPAGRRRSEPAFFRTLDEVPRDG